MISMKTITKLLANTLQISTKIMLIIAAKATTTTEFTWKAVEAK